MIFTVTLNPSVDIYITHRNYSCSPTDTGTKTKTSAGGKGINVSSFLTTLGIDNIALGLIGGETGKFILSELSKQNIKHQFIQISGTTRTNSKILEVQTKIFTEQNQRGPHITPDELNDFCNHLITLVKPNDTVILSGSLPPGISVSIYKDLISTLHQLGVKTVLDSSGNALGDGLISKPFFIKPNLEELCQVFNLDPLNEESILEKLKFLNQSGIKHVLLSMGIKGCIYAGDNCLLKLIPPIVTERNPVGAGDAMVASFLVGLMKFPLIENALKYAVAFSALTVTTINRNSINLANIDDLINKVKLIRY